MPEMLGPVAPATLSEPGGALLRQHAAPDRRIGAIYDGADEVVDVMQNIPLWARVAPPWSIAFGTCRACCKVRLTAMRT